MSQAVIEQGPDDIATTRARTTVAAALAMLGRCDEALTFVDTYLPTAFEQLDTSPLIAVQLLTARNGAFMRLGRVGESRELADQCLAVALVGESIDGTAVFESWAGRARLAAGDIQGARRHLIEAETLFNERDPLSLHAWTLYCIVQAAVWGGDLDAAHRALADAEAVRRCDRYFDGDLHLARILLATAEHRVHDAAGAIVDAVTWATDAEMPVEAAMAWHASVRLDRAADCVEPLARLSARMSNPFVADLAAHADAVARNDAAALESVAESFAARGLLLHACETATAARYTYERSGDLRRAQALASRSLEFAAACPGAQPSWWSSRRPLPELTARASTRSPLSPRTGSQVGRSRIGSWCRCAPSTVTCTASIRSSVCATVPAWPRPSPAERRRCFRKWRRRRSGRGCAGSRPGSNRPAASRRRRGTSAASIVRFWCETTSSCASLRNSCTRSRNRCRFTSSSAASTSSIR